jgi:diguanylate cyclase (GGDEF)-like protein/PAS domain S-box-containing protein
MATALFWVFTNADTISVSGLQAYSRTLRDFRQVDTQINADVLAIRFDLHKNFDAISQDINHLDTLLVQLRTPPGFLPANDTRKILELVGKLDQQVKAKNDHIGIFMRESSVLRNSVRYFPTMVRQFINSPHPPHLRGEILALSNDLMTYLASDDGDMQAGIFRHIESIRSKNTDLPPMIARDLSNVLDHADILLKGRQAVDSRLQEITTISTDARLEEIVQAYNTAHENAADTSRTFRVLLFASALLLGLYLALLFARLGRATQALQDTNRNLENRIDELHRTQANLKLYATLFNSAAEGMVITDANAKVLAANPAVTSITGYSVEELRLDSMKKLNSGKNSRPFYNDIWKSLGRHGKWQGEISNRRKNGEEYPEWLSISTVYDGEGNVTHYISVFSDITERKKNEEHIQHLSRNDPLTDLPNRLLMHEKLNEALSEPYHTAVLFVNLDRFRNINDTLGSELGDALLKQVAKRIKLLLRQTDTVSRLGSDEFVCVLPDIDQPKEIANKASSLLVNIGKPYRLGVHDIAITASIGIAFSGTDGNSAAELLRNADTAMSRAKEDGRNNFRFYSADMNITTLGDLLLENQLRSAIDSNELELFYQPKIDSKTGILQGAEALLRWRHPEQGLIQPSRFIRMAEESGLIIPIGKWVLNKACQQIRAWRDVGLPVVPIAVNLSAQQFQQSNLLEQVKESLENAGVEPGLLELELTESMLMRNAERTISILSNLRQMGVSLSIDDFGTGYSSLSYLKQFEINLLKIDKSFVADIQNTDSGGAIAMAVIGLAHALGLKVVAEGVETEEQHRFLLDHGCDFFQGYLFSRPVPAPDFAQKLASLKEISPEG